VPVGALDEVFAVVQRLGNAGFLNIWVRHGTTVIYSPAPIAQLAPVQMAQSAITQPTITQMAQPVRTQPTTAQTAQPAATLPEGMNIESSSYVTYTPGAGVTIFQQVRIGQARSIAPPEHTAALITEEIERLGLQDVFVREVDDGVMLSLENIHFYGDTYILRSGGREEIHRVAEILRLFPERNFLVAGHVNLGSGLGPWSTEEGHMRLSIYRANVVANYLIRQNIPANRITIRGYGATRMIASNIGGEAWRNKRAEITILDN
ncbi:MAG: OmpA family protein, partial [Treponema sp.]|nr:OmpA family protein [Treponema sp.]